MDDVVAVVTDLFFQARISAAAKAADRRLTVVGSERKLADVQDYCLALVDLDANLDIIGSIRKLAQRPGGRIVAFGPHLDTETRKAARSAGAQRVLAKSKFVTELPHLMNNRDAAGGTESQNKRDAAIQTVVEYGRRMEELGKLLQDPANVPRIYFAPDPHMEEAEAHGNPVVLDSADYLPFLAVESLRSRINMIREMGTEDQGTSFSTRHE
jgi:hypothetical protein